LAPESRSDESRRSELPKVPVLLYKKRHINLEQRQCVYNLTCKSHYPLHPY